LDSLLVVDINASDFLQFLLFECQLMSEPFVVALLVVYFRNVEPLAIFLKLGQHVVQVLQFLLIVLLLDQLYLQVLLMLLEFFLNDASVCDQTAACHIVLVLEVEDFLLELVDGVLDLTLFLYDFVQFATLLQGFHLFQLLLVVLDDLLVVYYLCVVDLLPRRLRWLVCLFSLLLLLLQIEVDYFLELLEHPQ